MEHISLFLRLLCSSFFLISAATNTYGYTNETDREALLAIKDQIQDDPSRVLSSWSDSLHFCDWHGVTCSDQNQRVTGLNMSSLKMVGSLSPHVGNLTFLTMVNLEDNFFHGTIPQEIGRLSRLQNLRLANNSFHGTIPTNLTRCSDLQVIDVNGNDLEGTILVEFNALSKLQQLSLSRNRFSGKIPPSLGNLTSLRVFSLSDNNLQGSIPVELGKLSNLQAFQVTLNQLSGTIPAQFYNISSIEIFAVNYNLFTGHLPSSLGLNLPKLHSFLAEKNRFSGSIPASFANATGIVKIYLGGNVFNGPIPLELGSLQELLALHLGGNPLRTEASKDFSFLTSFTNCTKLRALSLYEIGFEGALPNSIANLSTTLTSLYLHDNYISGSIPVGIVNLVNLAVLKISNNKLTGRIPDSIGKLTRLHTLNISSNKISGRIPSSIGNITRLSILALQQNVLEDSIPASLGNCRIIEVVNLSHNHLTGPIPEQIFHLSSVTRWLYLARNRLNGSLPSQVGDMKNLEVLDISENKLSGEIPNALGDCLKLESLYIQSNSFRGSVPSTFELLKGIQVMDLSGNNLSGQIPRFFGEYPFIKKLNLSYNMFEGEVLKEGMFMNVSVFSVEGNNKLCGGIEALQLPECPATHLTKGTTPKIVVVTCVVIGILSIACGGAILYRIRRQKQERRRHKPEPDLPSSPESTIFKMIKYPKHSYAELLRATNGFSPVSLIGEGTYGSVYKGTLDRDNQTVVAVKVLNQQEEGAKKCFMAECKALSNIRHRNIVKLITACTSMDYKGNEFSALVYEFMPNGSLESWLHPHPSDQHPSRSLNLVQRLNVAIDVASALDYLHNYCETPIVHRDLKPSNILLDDDLCAHIGDFGLARFLFASTGNPYRGQKSSIGINGTVGYVAPEYGLGGEVSTKGDVYSYGIILLEMFTRKRPTSGMFLDNFSLQNYAKMALPARVTEIVDPLLVLEQEDESKRDEKSGRGDIGALENCLAMILQIGVVCCAELPRQRMYIRDVLAELHDIRNAYLSIGAEKEKKIQN
ncbi:probable LRR receptor-like serine/threonine-protein kinase At3g47570 [Cornus florida]|uniref:probable LRR receptor-like serine/threonine-protein kinase At3g47570 n=1 Tax=Cornus florida TaxID=4283 RepID=UPI00289FD8E2|nr:probable LRR receptor-like serine/threonine-protein kinase At3g47570 [Cornus florida]